MLYLISWGVVVLLLALWTLIAWAADAVLVWTLTHAGTLGAQVPGATGIDLPAWFSPWLTAESSEWLAALSGAVMQVVQSLLQFAPALADGLGVVVWVVWAIGGLLLLGLGVAGHLLIGAWQRHRRGRLQATRAYAA